MLIITGKSLLVRGPSMRKDHFPLPLLFFVAMLGLAAAAQAQTYSWKDANGKVHYGDRPPTEKQVEARKLQAAPVETSDAAIARKTAAEKQFEQRDKQASKQSEAGKAAEEAARERDRAENCKRARSALAGLESGHIRFGLNDRGERIALDGMARDSELNRAKKSVAELCKPPAAK
jgi:hypothetical protein